MFFIQRKLLATLMISLIIIIFFIYLIVFPLIDKIKENSEEYLSNQEIINRLDKREYMYKKLQKSYDEKDNELLVTEKILINDQETAGFIFILEKLAEQTNNVFEIKTASSFSPSEEKEAIPFLSFKISLFGNFSNMLNFLSNLEDNPYTPYRLIEINGVNIKRLVEKDLVNLEESISVGNLETVLDIKVYIQ
ncbi:MAG: hypothetical protein ABIG88_01980 [Patescibacteria group bacterium]|nr:hypothetical protein [Patescibacteria group bacterium]